MSQKHMRKIFLYMLPEHLNNDEYAVDMMRIDFVSAIDLFTSVKWFSLADFEVNFE